MMNQIQKIQFKNMVERVFHVPGNYTGGYLEMTIVIDYNFQKDKIQEQAKDIVTALKSFGEVFRNVRLNTVKWFSDEQIKTEVTAMAFLQVGKYFESYEVNNQTKRLEPLFHHLKLFHARSKLILILTDGNYQILDEDSMKEHLQPFLYRKL
ncbi:MAG TPA: hypothetical protein VHQ24_02075, partial [Lachnospiraceae bacterium]|nr:hypothetical protein [Lachnospiraceae bacterium]